MYLKASLFAFFIFDFLVDVSYNSLNSKLKWGNEMQGSGVQTCMNVVRGLKGTRKWKG